MKNSMKSSRTISLAVFSAAAAVFVLSMGAVAAAGLPVAPAMFTEQDALKESEKYLIDCNDVANKSVEKIESKYKYASDTAKEPERVATFFAVSCFVGAYNSSSILLSEDTYASALVPVSFVTPRTNSKEKLAGFVASVVTGELTYDPAKKTLSSYSRGRGLGDAYVLGIYQIFEGEVILRRYEIDSTFDGKINGKVVYESKESLAR